MVARSSCLQISGSKFKKIKIQNQPASDQKKILPHSITQQILFAAAGNARAKQKTAADSRSVPVKASFQWPTARRLAATVRETAAAAVAVAQMMTPAAVHRTHPVAAVTAAVQTPAAQSQDRIPVAATTQAAAARTTKSAARTLMQLLVSPAAPQTSAA